MSSDHTLIDVEAMKRTARQIDQLMDDMTAFDELMGHQPVAGEFDAGTWLTTIVRDRQAGLLQHATDLKNAFANMASKLQTVAEDFASADTTNADGLAKSDRQAQADLGEMLAQSSASFDSGDSSNPGGARETIAFDPNGGGSTVTLTDGSTRHVDGGEP